MFWKKIKEVLSFEDLQKEFLEEYSDIVAKNFRSQSEAPIFSSTHRHRNILIANILRSAKEEIKIFVDGGDYASFPIETCEEIRKKILKKKLKLKIILDTKQNKDKFEMLFDVKSKVIKYPFYSIDNVFWLQIDANFYCSEGFEKIKHFIVVDKKAYWIEQPNKCGGKSIGGANGKYISGFLSNVFDFIEKEKTK